MTNKGRRRRGRQRLCSMVIAASLTVGLGVGTAAAQPAAPDAQLVQAKAALAKYADPIVAVHDGYFSTLGCVEFPDGAAGPGRMTYAAGGMGVHFFNTALMGPTLDPTRPQVLLYEPVGDELRLVGAEWFVPLAVGVKETPSIFGQQLQGPMEGHHPLMPAAMHHWDLHVWLWKPNPLGMFSPTNPDLKCPKTGYSLEEQPPKLVPHP